jgi:homogentisate phytyltransferase/homogentisate geranylgeranyltransferase
MSRAGEALFGALVREGSLAGRSAPPVVLWRFARPHTIVGTTLSVLSLYAIAVAQYAGGALDAKLFDLLWTLVAAWCVNVFIVGINQIEDVEIDRINKPFLPIAAGDLSPVAARRIVVACAVIPLVLAVTQGVPELIAVALGLAIGTAYSVPPLRLKRYPALASLSITFVRSVVVNVGVWLHFSSAFGAGYEIAAPVWALIAVTVPFSFAIAILKDMPDVEGDRRYAIATLSVRLGARPVVALGVAALSLGELGMATVGAALLDGASTAVLVGGHLLALALLWWWAARVDLADRASIVRFYMRVWTLFFLEYVIVAAAYLLGS